MTARRLIGTSSSERKGESSPATIKREPSETCGRV